MFPFVSKIFRLINDQMKPALVRTTDSFHSLNWNQYHSLEEIYAWIDELVEAYPDVVSSVTIGESVEGRPIRVSTIHLFCLCRSIKGRIYFLPNNIFRLARNQIIYLHYLIIEYFEPEYANLLPIVVSNWVGKIDFGILRTRKTTVWKA